MELTKIEQLFPEATKQRRLLGVWAHPDDESLNIGGILALANQAGINTQVVCLTHGELGLPESSKPGIRERELKKATQLLGVTKTTLADFGDSKLADRQEDLKVYLEKLIATYKPQVVITHDPSGRSGHPDHLAISKVLWEIWRENNKSWQLYFSVFEQGIKQLYQHSRRLTVWENMPKASLQIKVTKVTDQKIAACLSHKSQSSVFDKPIPLKIFLRMFDSECLHLANEKNQYNFQFVNFSTQRYTYRVKGKNKSFSQ